MANQNTKHAHHAGFSGRVARQRGGPRDWGQRTGTRIDSGEQRARSGKARWVGGSPPRKERKPRRTQ